MNDFKLGDLITDGRGRFVVLGIVEQDAAVTGLTIGATYSQFISVRAGNILVARFELYDKDWDGVRYPPGYLNCVYSDYVNPIEEG